jgi:hypothetical protein
VRRQWRRPFPSCGGPEAAGRSSGGDGRCWRRRDDDRSRRRGEQQAGVGAGGGEEEAEVLHPGQSGVHAPDGSALQRPPTPCGECPLSEHLIFEIAHFPSPRSPPTVPSFASIVSRSAAPKTCGSGLSIGSSSAVPGASCILYCFSPFSHIWFDVVFGYVFCPCLARRG